MVSEQPSTSKSPQQASQLEAQLAHELPLSHISKSAGKTELVKLQQSQPSTSTPKSTKRLSFEDKTAFGAKRSKISGKINLVVIFSNQSNQI